MSGSLEDRVALVTGGSRGLGRGIAVALAGAGAEVVVAARTEPALEQAVLLIEGKGGRGRAITWDLEEDAPGLVDRVVEEVGRIDLLVHAAGNQVRTPALELDVRDWDRIHRVHLRAAFLLCQTAARDMVGRGEGGSIVLVGSLTSWRVGVPDTVAYGAAKSGLLGLMRTLAVEWAEYGIRVNTVAPGFFATEMTRDVADHPRRSRLLDRIPMGRQGDPEDLAGAVVFLASDASDYVTGQVLTVDGGWTVA